jgi:hypothetical protein
MTQGIAVKIGVGKRDPLKVYIQLKNKNIYVYPHALTAARVSSLITSVQDSGRKVRLKHWKKVR